MTDHREYPVSSPIPSSNTNALLVMVLVVLSGGLAYQIFTRDAPARPTRPVDFKPRAVTPKGELGADEQSTISIFRDASPSVVFIRTKGYANVLFGSSERQEISSGTGFVWDKQGHIVTNLHVVEDALNSSDSELEVQFADQTVVDAEIIGGVREFDIAVLRISVPEQQLSPILLGTSDDLQVGQQVLAIGSPFGFDQTLSTGVIGGLNRSVARENNESFLDGLIQTDAAINPGNSGGPLLDSSGRLIGVNTAIVSPTGAYSGLGFAVPATSVIESVEMVLAESSGNQKPVLGISILSPEQATLLGVPTQLIERGLFIKQIDPTGPAAKAGLRPMQQSGFRIFLGDQIAAIDGTPVNTLEQLHATLKQYVPGDVVTLEVYRDSRRGEVDVTLEARKLLF